MKELSIHPYHEFKDKALQTFQPEDVPTNRKDRESSDPEPQSTPNTDGPKAP
ncbi:MAG: hypothetical protein HYU36_00620 [Planctomycetes bacterium]|nr:hypothetical protein [Planctomycetota bacterium]